MRDFPNVFLDIVSDLLLEREVEFAINLVAGISHVSMAPYRMPVLELSELNKQRDGPNKINNLNQIKSTRNKPNPTKSNKIKSNQSSPIQTK